jgi:hypothetical protein
MKSLAQLISGWTPARSGLYDNVSFGDTAPSLNITGAKPVDGYTSPDGTPLLYEVTYADGTKGYRSDSASDGKTGYTVSGVNPVDRGNGYMDNSMVSSPLDQVSVRSFKDSGSESPFETVINMGKQMAKDYVLPSVGAYYAAAGMGNLLGGAEAAGEGFTLDASMLDPTNAASGVKAAADAGITAAQGDMAAHLAASSLPGATSSGLLDSGFTLDKAMLDPTNPASGVGNAAQAGIDAVSQNAAASFAESLAANSPGAGGGLLDTVKQLAKDNPMITKAILSGAGGLLGAQGPEGDLVSEGVNNVGPGGNTFIPPEFQYKKPQGSSAYTGGLLFGGRR